MNAQATHAMRRFGFSITWFLRLRRRRCGEFRNVREPQRVLDGGDLSDGIFEAVVTEGGFFDLLELVSHRVELLLGHRLLPRGENDRVLDRGVLFVHARETV